jgi:SAM-dependent methyltransferase
MNTGFSPFPWLALLLLAAVLFGTLRSRRRLRRMPVLTSGSAARAGGQADREAEPRDFAWLTVAGIAVDKELENRAVEFATAQGLLVVDLVPGDMPVEPLLDLLHEFDPIAFRTDPVARGRGAEHALLVHTDVLRRAGVAPARDLTRAELAHVTARLKHYAARSTGHAIVPGLRGNPPDARAYKKLTAARGGSPVGSLGGLLGETAAFAGAGYGTPFWGLLAFAAWWVQPYAVVAGRAPVRPRDAAVSTLGRPFLAAIRRLRAAAGPAAPARWTPAEDAARRSAYAAELVDGTDRFFEPRATACPWCGSDRLRVRLRTKDRLQGKPGRFVLDRCRDCGHTFQNPRLSLDGLSFYYRDFYDGLGADGAEAMFAGMTRHYRNRARLVRRHAAPARWLDVGTGHAHMCLIGKSELPDTAFDGLDLGAGVEEAARRGWIDHAYVGQFPDHADTLAGRYDVVSMHHYLEHTRDPGAELDAAAKVVIPGGHLLIEVPDPQCWYARLLRRRWHPWFQPQHQHFVPLGNLAQALTARGFTVAEVERGPAHQGQLFMAAATATLAAVAPDPRQPWAVPRFAPARRVWRGAATVVFVPVFAAAALLDLLGSAAARTLGPAGGSDAYRVLARKEPG